MEKVKRAAMAALVFSLLLGCGTEGSSQPTGAGATGPPPVGPPTPLSLPPAGFGSAVIIRDGVTVPGLMHGWTWLTVGEWVSLDYASGGTMFQPSNWPRAEGPADFTTGCRPDFAFGYVWESCSFHFTEMKLGDPLWPDQTGRTWYFHGTLQARDRVGTPYESNVSATF
jgi:hypothetical protein